MKKLTGVIKDIKGMTLVETLAAIAIFAIVLTGILDLCVGSMATGRRAEYVYTSYNLAKNHLETLRSMPYSTLQNAAESDVLVDENGVSDPDGGFIRTTTVTPDYDGDANLIQLTVSVDYLYRGDWNDNPTTLSAVVFQYA
jgi:prepilin-type N-terminal cleavage/methylation domain-containing protein